MTGTNVCGSQPDLVIAHFSGLYGFMSYPQEKRFHDVIAQILHRTNAKIIIYSRWQLNFNGQHLGPMDEFLSTKLGDLLNSCGRRIYTLNVSDLNLEHPDFSQPALIDALKGKVREALSLPTD